MRWWNRRRAMPLVHSVHVSANVTFHAGRHYAQPVLFSGDTLTFFTDT